MNKKIGYSFLFGGIFGASFIMILSLSMGWFVTSGRAYADAEEISAQAVYANLVPICVHQFQAADGSSAKLKSMLEMSSWKWGDYIENGGWATMPGGDGPARGVAKKCAEALSQVEQS